MREEPPQQLVVAESAPAYGVSQQPVNPIMELVERRAIETANKIGRPSLYEPELASKVINAVAAGQMLWNVCKEEWAPSWNCVWLWVNKHPEFSDALARARQYQCHAMADMATMAGSEALQALKGDKSDSARVNAYRLQHEAFKWRAGIHVPEYRDKQNGSAVAGAGVTVNIMGLDVGLQPSSKP